MKLTKFSLKNAGFAVIGCERSSKIQIKITAVEVPVADSGAGEAGFDLFAGDEVMNVVGVLHVVQVSVEFFRSSEGAACPKRTARRQRAILP